jgi:hypothetical protein
VVEFCKQHLETAEDSMEEKQEFFERAFGRTGEVSFGRRVATPGNVGSAAFPC